MELPDPRVLVLDLVVAVATLVVLVIPLVGFGFFLFFFVLVPIFSLFLINFLILFVVVVVLCATASSSTSVPLCAWLLGSLLGVLSVSGELLLCLGILGLSSSLWAIIVFGAALTLWFTLLLLFLAHLE